VMTAILPAKIPHAMPLSRFFGGKAPVSDVITYRLAPFDLPDPNHLDAQIKARPNAGGRDDRASQFFGESLAGAVAKRQAGMSRHTVVCACSSSKPTTRKSIADTAASA
jgi:hypothetical protein